MGNITIKIQPGQMAIVHLVNVINPTVVYGVGYNPDVKSTSCDSKISQPIVRGGIPLQLTPENTPLVLELPGEYELIKQSLSAGTIAYEVVTASPYVGDVQRLSLGAPVNATA